MNMFQSKKNINKERTYLYSTDNKMYGVLSVIIIIITVLVVILLKFILNNGSGLMSSAVIGLLSGILASSITSWLLDLATCKKKNRLIKKSVDDDLDALGMWLDNLFQAMRNCLPSQDCENGLTIETLFPLFVERCIINKKLEASEGDTVGLYVYANMIISIIDKLTSGEEKEYLLTMYDDVYPFLILGKSISDFRENLFNNGNFRFDFIYLGINDFLSTVLKYIYLRSKKYSVIGK